MDGWGDLEIKYIYLPFAGHVSHRLYKRRPHDFEICYLFETPWIIWIRMQDTPLRT